MSEDIKDYIARAQAAQQEHDVRPGTQTALDFKEDHPDHDCDPGDCNDYKGG